MTAVQKFAERIRQRALRETEGMSAAKAFQTLRSNPIWSNLDDITLRRLCKR